MASTKATKETDGAVPTIDGAQKERRRARALVNEVLLGIATPLENRGIGKRFLPGLWHASLNVLLTCFEPDDVLAILQDRARITLGDGTNHDAPPKVIPTHSMPNYVRDVESAASTIMEGFDRALERMTDEGIEDRFPETVLDASLQVLIPAWGPAHVRRALSEQAALVIRGVLSPANFMEPSRLQSSQVLTHRKERTEDRKPEQQPELAPAHAPAAVAPVRDKVARHVTAYASTDVDSSGRAAWAVALSSHDDDGRTEIREISGTMHDPTGRAASLRALREAILAACETASRASVLIETSSELGIRGAVEGDRPGSRLPGEEAIWDEIDRASSLHRIEFRHVPASLDRELSERCDRMLRDRVHGPTA